MSGLPEDFPAALLAAVPDAVVFPDATGTILYSNDGAAWMFGHAAEQALGSPLDCFRPVSAALPMLVGRRNDEAWVKGCHRLRIGAAGRDRR